MTEKEFRNALKNAVGDAGLSPDRQQKVLAQMKGEERTVRTSYKMKTALILAAVMLLGSTALAAGIMGYAKWDGTTVEDPYTMVAATPLPALATDAREDSREAVNEAIYEILNSCPEGEAVIVSYPEDVNMTTAVVEEIRVSTMEEAKQQIASSLLPLPSNIPEGYTLTNGWVDYLCSAEGSYELISTETTEEGLMVEHLRLPDEYAVLLRYYLSFENQDGHTLWISAELHSDSSESAIYTSDHTSVKAVDAPGMDNALLLGPRESTGEKSLRMRRSLSEQVRCIMPQRMPTHSENEYVLKAYDEVSISIFADVLTEQELLAIFAE